MFCMRVFFLLKKATVTFTLALECSNKLELVQDIVILNMCDIKLKSVEKKALE